MDDTTGVGAVQSLVRGFAAQYPGELAAILESAPAEEAAELLAGTDPARALPVFLELSLEAAASIVESASDTFQRQVIVEMEPSRAAALLARLDENLRERLLDAVPRSVAKELRDMMAYNSDQAGSLMDPRVTMFRPEVTVAEALARLRKEKTRFYNIFLVDEGGYLAGAIPIQELVLAEPHADLRSLARSSPVSVQAIATREEVGEILEQHELSSLPVVDFEGRLIGVIRHGTLVDTVEQEASADLQIMTGAAREERALSPVGFAVKKRLVWLQINLLTAFLAAAVVGLFEDTIAKFTALAVLLPVVAGQSGNTGAQALAVTIRGLALREITMRRWLRVMTKEAAVGLINGVVVALVTVAAVYWWSGSLGLCFVIGVAMVLAMTIAAMAGAVIPLLLTAAGQDPAQSSSIFLTTVTDIFGFFSFLGLATLLSSML